jgi:hypothetical protein
MVACRSTHNEAGAGSAIQITGRGSRHRVPRSTRGPQWRRRFGSARRPTLGLSLALIVPVTIHAQSALHSVSLFADLATDDGSAEVAVEIDFVLDDTADVRIELIGFGNGRTDGFFANGADGPLIRFTDRSGSREWVVIAQDDFERIGLEQGRIADGVFEPHDASGTPAAGPPATPRAWRLRATYVVRNTGIRRGETVRVHVPVLTLALPPARDAGTVFRARVRLRSNWSVSEAFPTGMQQQSDGTWAVDLAAAPAVISFRARTDGAWRPGVPLLLDLLAGAILFAVLVVGGRHVRTSASAAGSRDVAFDTDG